jgi:hypothetical protein
MTSSSIPAALTQGPDRPCHGSIRNRQEPQRKRLRSELLPTSLVPIDRLRQRSKLLLDDVEIKLAGEEVGDDAPEEEVCVGDGQGAAFAVACGPGVGACAAGTDLQEAVFPGQD